MHPTLYLCLSLLRGIHTHGHQFIESFNKGCLTIQCNDRHLREQRHMQIHMGFQNQYKYVTVLISVYIEINPLGNRHILATNT